MWCLNRYHQSWNLEGEELEKKMHTEQPWWGRPAYHLITEENKLVGPLAETNFPTWTLSQILSPANPAITTAILRSLFYMMTCAEYLKTISEFLKSLSLLLCILEHLQQKDTKTSIEWGQKSTQASRIRVALSESSRAPCCTLVPLRHGWGLLWLPDLRSIFTLTNQIHLTSVAGTYEAHHQALWNRLLQKPGHWLAEWHGKRPTQCL